MAAGTIESGFVRGEERWLAQESTGRSVSLSYDHIVQSLAVTAPGRDKVYFIAPSKSHLVPSARISFIFTAGCDIARGFRFTLNSAKQQN